jgi:hypothetical protein
MFRKLRSLIIYLILLSIILLFIYSGFLPNLARGEGATPGPYLAVVFKAPFTPSLTPSLTATPSYGILLISEVMVQPASYEPDGEWVELFNSGGGIIDLSTYKLGDEETISQGEGMLQFPVEARLTPGQVIVVANNAANFYATYGFYPDYEMTASSPAVPDMHKVTTWASGTVNLANTGDEVLVLDSSDALVDTLSWGDSSWAFYPACPAPDPAWTLERYPAYMDTNTASDWRTQSSPAPGTVDLTQPTSTPTLTPSRTASPTVTSSPTSSRTTTLTNSPTGTPFHTPGLTHTPTYTSTSTPVFNATPTQTNTPTSTPTPTTTPTHGWLLISEVMYDPFSVEPDGEWIELYNASDTVIDLSYYKVGDEVVQGNPEGMYQFPAGAAIDPGQVILIANRADVFTTTYGIYPDYELIDSDGNVPNLSKYITWSDGWVNLANLGDEVLVLDNTDNFVDAVSWGDSIWFFDPTCPVVAEGHSIERYPADVDTDTAADWIDQASPNPGQVSVFHLSSEIEEPQNWGNELVYTRSFPQFLIYSPPLAKGKAGGGVKPEATIRRH